MAKLVLEVESNALKAFSDATTGMNNLTNSVDTFEKESKASFTAVNKEVENHIQKTKESATEAVNAVNKTTAGRRKESEQLILLKAQIADIADFEKKLQAQRDASAPGKQQSDLNKKLAEVRFNLKETEKEFKKLEEAEKALEPPVVSLKAQLKSLKEQIANTTDPEEFQRLSQQAGEIQDKLGDATDSIRAFSKESKAGTAKTLFNQIGADIADLDFKGAADKAKQFAGVIKSISFKETIKDISSLGNSIITVGKAIITSPFFLLVAAIVAIGLAINGMVESFHIGDQALKDNAEALKEVTEATEDLIRANKDLAIDNDVLTKTINKATGERLKNQNKFKNDYMDLLQEQRKAEKKLNEDIEAEKEDDGFKATKRLYEFFGGETEVTKKQKKGLKDIESAYGKELLAIQDHFKLVDKKIAAEDALEKEKKAKEFNDKLIQYKKDLSAALLDLSKKSVDAEIAILYGTDKLDAQLNAANASVGILKQELIKKKILAGQAGKLSLVEQAQFDSLIAQNAQTHSDGLIAIAVEQANLIAKAEEVKTKNVLEAFDLRQQKLIDAANGAKQPKGVSDEVFELQKQRAVLNIQRTGVEDRLALEISELNRSANLKIVADKGEIKVLEGHTDTVSKLKREALQLDIDTIKAKTPEEVDALKAKYDAQLAELNKSIKDNAKAMSNRPVIDWATIFGVSQEQAALIVQGVNDVLSKSQALVDQQFSIQQKGLDNEIAIIEKRTNIRDQEINDLESRLKDEEKFRKEGLANNVQTINDEISAKMQANQKDLDEQKKIQEQKKKLAKQQLVIDTALQASQMVTAVATTINTYAAVPYVAAALVALEIGTFIAAKAAAFKAINQQGANNFAKGVIDLQGPGTKTSDSIPANLSKGESVMTADETQDNMNLFKGIRNKDGKLIVIGIRDLIKNTGVSLSEDMPRELSQMKSDARVHEISVLVPKKDMDADNRMDSIEGNIKQLVKQGTERNYLDANGNLVIQRGSLRQVITKKK